MRNIPSRSGSRRADPGQPVKKGRAALQPRVGGCGQAARVNLGPPARPPARPSVRPFVRSFNSSCFVCLHALVYVFFFRLLVFVAEHTAELPGGEVEDADDRIRGSHEHLLALK